MGAIASVFIAYRKDVCYTDNMSLKERTKLVIFWKFFLISLFFVSSLVHTPSDARAEFLKLKNPGSIKLQRIGGRVVFDKKKKEKVGIPVDQDADIDFEQKGNLIKIWSYADSKGGSGDARVRGIDYEDFVLLGDVPPNSKVKCDLLVVYECYGLGNIARYGAGKAFYYAKLNSGLLVEEDNGGAAVL